MSIFSSLPLSADTTGSPTVGPTGVSETTSTIAARIQEENPSQAGDPNSYAPDDCVDRSNLPQNPKAPDRAHSGVSTLSLEADAGESGAETTQPQPAAPQTTSTNFLAATFNDTVG